MKKIVILFLLFLSSSVYSYDVVSVKGSYFFEDLEFPCYGKGVAVKKDVVLTALHIVESDNPLFFITPSVMFKGIWLGADIIGKDEENDLVLLKVKGAIYSPIELLSLPLIEIVGSPGREEVNRIKARAATIESFESKVDVIKNLPNYELAGGLSGSPAVCEGRLIGIVSKSGRRNKNVNLLLTGPTPISNLLEKYLKDEEEKK